MRKIGSYQQTGILEADMKHVMKLWLTLWIAAALTGAALAQETAAPSAQTEDWEALRTQVQEMRAQAKEMRAAATTRHSAEHAACWEKFLVSSCQDEAKKTLRASEREAKRLEVEAGRNERRIQAYEREVKKQRRIDEAPQRAAESARRGEQIRRKEAEATQRMEEKRADIARRQRPEN